MSNWYVFKETISLNLKWRAVPYYLWWDWCHKLNNKVFACQSVPIDGRQFLEVMNCNLSVFPPENLFERAAVFPPKAQRPVRQNTVFTLCGFSRNSLDFWDASIFFRLHTHTSEIFFLRESLNILSTKTLPFRFFTIHPYHNYIMEGWSMCLFLWDTFMCRCQELSRTFYF